MLKQCYLHKFGVFTLFATAVLLAADPSTAYARGKSHKSAPRLPQVVHQPQENQDNNQVEAVLPKKLRALVAYSKTDFFFSDNQPRGLAYDFVREYEKFLNEGVKKAARKTRIQIIPVAPDQLIPSLLSGQGDLAATMLSITPERQEQVAFATSAEHLVDELVVTHGSEGGFDSLQDLSGRTILLTHGHPFRDTLGKINQALITDGHKPIKIKEAAPELSTEDLLEMVNSGAAPMTIAEDYKARLWAKVLPAIKVQEELKLTSAKVVGIAVQKQQPELRRSLESFLHTTEQNVLLGTTSYDHYFENTDWIANLATDKEQRKLRNHAGLFKRYGNKYGIDHLALLAQAYKESGLVNVRRGMGGAVGIMQILPSTARASMVGMPNIANLETNIHAGAKYLAYLRDTFFSDPKLRQEDRFAFTWAAYNMGPNKLLRMREKAEEMGLDPDRWFGNVELAAGKALGRQVVKYVSDVYKYYVALTLLNETNGES